MKKNKGKEMLAISVQLTVLAAVAFSAAQAIAADKTYTFNADFAQGTLDGVNYTVVSDQLQLNATGTTFPVAWIANAGEDTVSKFDTNLNKEVARYRTWFGPSGQPGHISHLGNAYTGPAPSRTAVDIEGNAYVLNRHFSGGTQTGGTLIKILAEGFIDRNGNGVMDTSVDTNNDGLINAAEMKAMADSNANGIIDDNEIQDERIAWAKRVPDGIAAPLVNTGSLARSLCIGTDGNLWVGLFNNRTYYKVRASNGTTIAGPISTTPTTGQPSAGSWTPYGCLIDANGTLWSASLSGVLGKITNTQSNVGPWAVSSFAGGTNYGIGLGNGKVYLGNSNQQFNPLTNTFSAIPNMTSTAGIVVDGAGNIIGGQTTVRKVSPAGALLWSAPLQSGGSSSVGIQVDANGDVLQIGMSSVGRIQKYSGVTGAPLGTFPVGNLPYTYSDATGIVSRTVTSPTGTWVTVFDSGENATPWDNLNWSDNLPVNTSVVVSVRASDNQASLPSLPYQAIAKGAKLSLNGRYIQVQARLNGSANGDSPVLYDLAINSIPKIVCDVNRDGAINQTDISLISRARGQVALPNDLRDADGDGKITTKDAMICTTRVTQ